MKFRLGRKAALILTLGLAGAALAGGLYYKSFDVTPTQPLPQLRTVCVGRVLLDLPVDIELKGDVELYYGLDKDFDTAMVEPLKQGADQQAFEKYVAERIAELTRDYNAKAPSKNMLAATRKIDDQTVMILVNKEIRDAYVVEALIRRGQTIGRVKRDVYHNSDLGGEDDDPRDIETKVLALAQRITAVGDDPARVGKGTCIGGLLIDADFDGEVFHMGARSSRYPDLTFGVDMNSFIAKSDGGMLKRVARKADLVEALGASGTDLRRGKVTMAGRAAEELVSEVKERGKVIRNFAGETLLLKPSSFGEPQISVDMSMGGQRPDGVYVDPSFSAADSLKLWDAIIKSIRPRPGAI